MKKTRGFAVLAIAPVFAFTMFALPGGQAVAKGMAGGDIVISAETNFDADPHMQASLAHLRRAKGELERAARDKGGHRENAVRLVNDAIAEVEKGISYDRRH